MAYDNIRSLIDKYFEAETSIEEEQQIASYFEECDDIPSDLLPVRDIFQSMAQLRCVKSPIEPHTATRQPSSQRRRTLWQWSIGVMSAAAACAIFGIMIYGGEEQGYPIATQQTADVICHVDGRRIDNPMAAQQVISQTFGIVSDNMLIAMAEVEKITTLR